MEIIKKPLTNGQYLTTEYVKDSIFWHHTAGPTAEGAWRWWNETPERVGTPYIIDRNGVTIEAFDPKMWAFHLGIIGDDNYFERHSVNIELVSCGRLYYQSGQFIFYPLYPNTMYPRVIPESEVYEFKKPWRGHSFYHKYSDEQVLAAKDLLGHILDTFPTIKIEPIKDFYEYNPKVITDHIPGMWAHSTVRPDKDDIFPYPPLLKAFDEVITSRNIPASLPKSPPKSSKK